MPHRAARWIRRISKRWQRNSQLIERRAIEYARSRGFRYVTCGHTHLPLDRRARRRPLHQQRDLDRGAPLPVRRRRGRRGPPGILAAGPSVLETAASRRAGDADRRPPRRPAAPAAVTRRDTGRDDRSARRLGRVSGTMRAIASATRRSPSTTILVRRRTRLGDDPHRTRFDGRDGGPGRRLLRGPDRAGRAELRRSARCGSPRVHPGAGPDQEGGRAGEHGPRAARRRARRARSSRPPRRSPTASTTTSSSSTSSRPAAAPRRT